MQETNQSSDEGGNDPAKISGRRDGSQKIREEGNGDAGGLQTENNGDDGRGANGPWEDFWK